MVLRLRPRLNNVQGRRRWRWRFRQGDVDQPLHDIDGAGYVDVKAAEQRDGEPRLNEYNRGERISALPRPYD
jgi:hypothetical protein